MENMGLGVLHSYKFPLNGCLVSQKCMKAVICEFKNELQSIFSN